MISQLKAELFKLGHSIILNMSFLGILGIVLLSFVFGKMSFFAAGDGVITSIGFQAKSYANPKIPVFEEVLKSSFAYTWFFVVIILFLTVLFFTKEYNSGTIKLAVATGISRWNIYIAKITIILISSLFMFLAYTGIFAYIEIVQTNYVLKLEDIFRMGKIFFLNYFVIVGFIFFVIFLCVLLQNVGIVVGISCIYIFAGMSIYIMTWYKMNEINIFLKGFIYCNPMYYWMNLCANSDCSTVGFGVYLALSSIFLVLGGLLLEGREIK